MLKLDSVLGFMSLVASIFAIAVFLRASSEIELKRFIAESTGWFRSYVLISSCSSEAQGNNFEQGVFDIGSNLNFEAYKKREDTLLVFNIDGNRNVYSSLERLAQDQPSDSALRGDQFYVLRVESRKCVSAEGNNSYVEGVFHKR